MHFIYNTAYINTSFKRFKVLKAPSSDPLKFHLRFLIYKSDLRIFTYKKTM